MAMAPFLCTTFSSFSLVSRQSARSKISSFPASSPSSAYSFSFRKSDHRFPAHRRTVTKEQQKDSLKALLVDILEKLEGKQGKEFIIERFKALKSRPEG